MVSSLSIRGLVQRDGKPNAISPAGAVVISIGVVLLLILLLAIFIDIRRRIRARRSRIKLRRLALVAQQRWTIDGEKDGSDNFWGSEKDLLVNELEATPPTTVSSHNRSYSAPLFPPKAVTYIPGKRVGNLAGVLMTQAPMIEPPAQNTNDFQLPYGSNTTNMKGAAWPPHLVSSQGGSDSNNHISTTTEHGPAPSLVRHSSIHSQKAELSRLNSLVSSRAELLGPSLDSSSSLGAAKPRYILQQKANLNPLTVPARDGSPVPVITVSPATPGREAIN